MKLTQADRELLKRWGHPETDFPQIEEACHKGKTTYTMNGKRIGRDKAIFLLGREQFLSGISRSAFHFTAARETTDGSTILFNSANLFR